MPTATMVKNNAVRESSPRAGGGARFRPAAAQRFAVLASRRCVTFLFHFFSVQMRRNNTALDS